MEGVLADAFLCFPILVIGFSFFFGTITSNTGLLYLFTGLTGLGGALTYILNEKFWSSGQTGFFWFLAFIPLLIFNLWPFKFNLKLDDLSASNLQETLNQRIQIISSDPNLTEAQKLERITKLRKETPQMKNDNLFYTQGQMITKYVLFFVFIILNQLKKMNSETSMKTGETLCSLLPGRIPNPYTSPSAWSVITTFFSVFIFSNAYAIYKQPPPLLTSVLPDASKQKEREDSLKAKLSKRKSTTLAIMVLSIVLLVLFLGIRFTMTNCEDFSFSTLVSLSLVAMTSVSWFSFLHRECGVRPVDTLGIVSGMINPNLADNPIVCIGE